jgi:hypothetical protein
MSFSDFILTFAVEFFVLLAFFRKKPLLILFYCFLINLFSWPIANLVYDFCNNLLIVEIGVVLVESVLAMFLFKTKYYLALLVSFMANLVSFFVGAGIKIFI